MRELMLVLCFLAIPGTNLAQEFPKITEEGKKAAVELLDECIKGGAIAFLTDPTTKVKQIVVADISKLKGVVHQQRGSYTPELRDALLRYSHHPGGVQLLINLGLENHDKQAVAFGFFHQARLLDQLMRHDTAIKCYEVAAPLFYELKLMGWYCVSLNNLAAASRFQGEIAKARNYSQSAVDLSLKLYGERHHIVATSTTALGVLCRIQGDLPQARKLHLRALECRRQLFGNQHYSVATSLDNLALVCRDQGDLQLARKFQQEALDLYQRLPGEHREDLAICMNNLATVCLAQGDSVQARKLLEQALKIVMLIHGEQHHLVAMCLHNIAGIDEAQRDHSQAQKLRDQALGILKQLYGGRHPDVADSYEALAQGSIAQGNQIWVIQNYIQAVLASRLPQVNRSISFANHKFSMELLAEDLTCDPKTVSRVSILGLALKHSIMPASPDFLRQVARVYTLAANLLDRLRSDVLQTDESKLFQGAEHTTLVPARVHLAATLFALENKAEDLHTAFTAIEQGRARVFLETLARARSHQIGGVPNDLLQQEHDLRSHLRGIEGRIEKENTKTLEQRNATLVTQLYGELKEKRDAVDRFAVQLRKDYPQYAALQYPKPCTLDQALDCLTNNEVAVLFALDKKESYAVVLQKKPAQDDQTQGVTIVVLPGSDVLIPKVRTLIDAEVLKSDSRCRELGSELFELLLKPLAPHIQGKDFVLVPDGVLWELPFELLVEGLTSDSNGKYLIENRQIRYTPSMTVLHLIDLWQKTRQPPIEPLWALADPVFSKNDPRAKGDVRPETQNLLERYALRGHTGAATFDRLPATRAEVLAIAKLHGMGKEDVFIDDRASERVIKAASEKNILARKRYLHLSTHGILGVGLGRQPSLVLSLVGNDGAEQLGGVNDGFLTLEEVTHLKLNADLVVLSACETGKGDLKPAEGVVGLSRAFLYAGSRGIVCSLWQVDDERTATLMEAIYGHLKVGKSSPEALAQARRQMIAEEQAPFYWAPFILIGK